MKYKVKIIRDVATSCASYTSKIMSEVKTLWPDPIERSQVAEVLGSISSMIDDLDLVLNRKATTKGSALLKKYSDDYTKLYIYNVTETKVAITISFEPDYKTFKDLVFKPRFKEDPSFGDQAILYFDNNYGVSVLFGPAFYSNGKDTYEVGIIEKSGDGFVLVSDPLGYRTEKEVNELMKQVQLYREENNEVPFNQGI